jgi:phosphoglycerate dehydrogenase-like enzyme
MSEHHLLALGNPGEPHLALLARLPAGTRVTATADPAEAAQAAATATAILCDMGRGRLLEAAMAGSPPNLRWVHCLSAGVESVLFPAMLAHPAVLTNGRGMYKRALAEFVIAGCLYFAKDIARLRASQARGVWDPYYMQELAGRTMAIVGYGEIGQASAALAHAFGMRVLACRRRPELSRDDPNVERVVGEADRREIIAQADYVVAAAPDAPGASGLIGAAEFAAMKPTAVLVNVGRGPTLDEAELVAALRAGRIRGAALDVYTTEPLPAGHPLYGLDNVLLSPHCADRVEGWLEHAMSVFLDNHARFVAGEALRNIVDKKAGY